MKRFGRKYQKRLAKLVTVALMCTGWGLFSLSHVASAEEVKEVTWDGSMTPGDPPTPANVTPANAIKLSGYCTYISDDFVTQGYNTVTLISGITGGNNFYVTAGYNNSTDALSGFRLNVNSGIWSTVGGAFSNKGGEVFDNKVTISDGTVKQVFGGQSNVKGNVKDNEVYIKGGKVTVTDPTEECFVKGGDSFNGNSEHNTVTINGGAISGTVIGGNSSKGDATENIVNINGGTTTLGKVYGGRGGAASNNHVNIGEGSTVQYDYDGVINGGSGTGDVENNKRYAYRRRDRHIWRPD